MNSDLFKNFNINHDEIRDHSPCDLIVSDSGNISEIEVYGIKIPILSMKFEVNKSASQGEKPPVRFDDPIYYDIHF